MLTPWIRRRLDRKVGVTLEPRDDEESGIRSNPDDTYVSARSFDGRVQTVPVSQPHMCLRVGTLSTAFRLAPGTELATLEVDTTRGVLKVDFTDHTVTKGKVAPDVTLHWRLAMEAGEVMMPFVSLKYAGDAVRISRVVP